MPTHLLVAMVAAHLATLFAVARLWWIVRGSRRPGRGVCTDCAQGEVEVPPDLQGPTVS